MQTGEPGFLDYFLCMRFVEAIAWRGLATSRWVDAGRIVRFVRFARPLFSMV